MSLASIPTPRRLTVLLFLFLTLRCSAQAPPEALAGYQRYCAALQTRLLRQHSSPAGFVALDERALPGLHDGHLLLERLSPEASPPGALLHHWRATAFLPGTTRAGFEHLLRDLPAYPRVFAPEVLASSVGQRTPTALPSTIQATLRVRQHHVLTVVLDTAYTIAFGQLDPAHGFSTSRSTRVAEIADPGTPAEHALSPADEHGFLWAQSTFWSYGERDGGLLVQVESVSLSRAIPAGLGWAVHPLVERIPRESLEFTLRRAAAALTPASALAERTPR